MSSPRRIVIIGFEGLMSLDLTGPLEAFAIAGAIAPGAYEIRTASLGGGPVGTWTGLRITPDVSLEQVRGPIDTLIVAGGAGARAAAGDANLIAEIRRLAGASRRVASVCSGAFVLARAGLLDGRRATTHWAECAYLARRHPAIEVDHDSIFVRDGKVATSAGVTAGIDLSLALIEEDLGAEIAAQVARWLVVFVRRPGGQAQFSTELAAQTANREPLRRLQEWIGDHLADDLSVPALARRAAMSDRNFARAFKREVGMTPAAYVEAVRVERARIALETTSASASAVASRLGFGGEETMRRAFARRLGVTPGQYRARFRAAA